MVAFDSLGADRWRPDLRSNVADEIASRLARAYELFLSGNPDALLRLLSPDAVYHLPGRHMGGGSLAGRKAILERAMSAALACDAPPESRLLTAAGLGNFVVTIEHIILRRADMVLDQNACVVWRFQEDHCVELWSHFEDQGACDSFWNGWKPQQ